jgi:uncharacterized protein (TIGR00159 family)
MRFLEALKSVSILDLVDVFLMSILIYAVLVWVKKKRAFFILTGILICGLFYLVAYQLDLFLITYMLRAFFAVILIALIVIFREELRDLFEQIALWSINRGKKTKKLPEGPNRTIEILVRTLNELSRLKYGALIVLKGKYHLARHLEGGTELMGEISYGILMSIFDPHSEGHDGAVLIDENKIVKFGCHLPLSKDFLQLHGRGTRHAAALGLAENTDALCLVVSEERGKISVAHQGRLIEIADTGHLTAILQDFYQRMAPKPLKTSWREILRKNSWEKVMALGISLSLWFVLVYESDIIHKQFSVPIEYAPLPRDMHISEIDPPKAQVTFLGPRNAFHFINENNIRLTLKLPDPRQGTQTVSLDEGGLTFPEDIKLEKIAPSLVRVTIESEPIDIYP